MTRSECVPECVPSVSRKGEGADASRVCLSVPPPTGTDTLSEPHALCPPSVSPDPRNKTTNNTCTGRWFGPYGCTDAHCLLHGAGAR